MKAQYSEFIGMYQNVFPDGFCSHVISEFERLLSSGFCGNRQDREGVPKTRKEDYHYSLNMRNHVMSSFNNIDVIDIFMNSLQNCFDEYVSEFDILKDIPLKCTSVKMQKTDPGAGYHVWHCEQNTGDQSARCLVYSAYLNDIDDAGETEFLYQRLRIQPKENSMILWPAGFTHTHRGNVVHGTKSKYIITGWFYIE